MLEFGIALGVLIFAAAGYLAFRNSKLIAEKRQGTYIAPPSSEYTVYMTKEFSDEDYKLMIPLCTMEVLDSSGKMKVMLCRVKGETPGDLKLEEAGNILIHHIRQAHQKGTFISFRIQKEVWQAEEEIRMADRITEAVGMEHSTDLTHIK